MVGELVCNLANWVLWVCNQLTVPAQGINFYQWPRIKIKRKQQVWVDKLRTFAVLNEIETFKLCILQFMQP